MPSRSNFNSTKSAQRIFLKIRSRSQVSSYLKTLPIMPIDMPLNYHIQGLCENRRSRGVLHFKQPTLQNKVQLCCTLYQWFLHVEALDGLCMPTNECSKGWELLATNTKQKAFCSTNLRGVLTNTILLLNLDFCVSYRNICICSVCNVLSLRTKPDPTSAIERRVT